MKKKRTNPFGYGRIHTGLMEPEKYGLTFDEVVKLIDTSEWRNFYARWRRTIIPAVNVKKPKKKKKASCSLCRVIVEQYLRVRNVVFCSECANEIIANARRKTNIEAIDRTKETRLPLLEDTRPRDAS